MDAITESDCNMETETDCKESMASNAKEKQGKREFNQDDFNVTKKVIELNSQEKEKRTNSTVNTVSSSNSLTRSQIEEHIISLKKVIITSLTFFSVTLICFNNITCILCLDIFIV